MPWHMNRGGSKWLKLSMNGLYHFLSAVPPRISPQSVFEPVLGLWITISEFPTNFPNSNQSFEGVVTSACYFIQGLSLFTVLITLIYSRILSYKQ